jgi:two-component system, NtrC family, nitrogen regulation sensor histidine kinase NtrY
MTAFSSLTNRIFFASAALAVLSIGVAIYNVNVAVTAQAERELTRGLDEAGTLVEEYRRLLFDHFSREARLVADLPRLKAAVETNDPPTVRPIAEEYQRQLGADLLLVASPAGDILAEITEAPIGRLGPEALTMIRAAPRGRESALFLPHSGGILQIVSVPVWMYPAQPQLLGTLSVGFTLDPRAAARFKALTNSEVAFGIDGRIQASTLPDTLWPSLSPLLAREGLAPLVWLAGNEYIGATRRLAAGDSERAAMAIVLRSRTERLQFLNALHRTLAITAVLAVLAATLLSYAIARTVTRPLGAVTAAMRDMAATGDLTRRITPPPGGRWEDEDATLLAATFNTMTDSIGRFQREAAQRERLSSLGRLSTVVAHEIRNPLMIIKTALRSLRGDDVAPAEVRTAVNDIDEEIARLNRIVTEVLDFAKPIKFDLAPVDINALCEDAVRASAGDTQDGNVTLDLDRSLGPIVSDGERLRQALVNILANARHAVASAPGQPPNGRAIRVSTRRAADSRVAVRVEDRGAGIAPEDLPRVFEPYFTTRRTGSGIGLAISRNIIEGLGGTIALSSRPDEGTIVRIELPST